MRKRSEAMAEPAQQVAQQPAKKDEFFDDDKPRPPPEPSIEPTDARASVEEPRFHQERGIKYVKCDCGLKQSFQSAKGKDPTQLECIKCRKALGSLAAAEAALGNISVPVVVKPGDVPMSVVEFEKCKTCGALITESAVGKFWPCGHSPRVMEAAAKADADTKALEEAKKAAPNAFLDAPTKDAERAADIYKNPVTGREVKVTLPADAMSQRDVITRAPKLGVTTVSVGEMAFTPISFNTFKVGPFSATVGEGETPEEVMAALKAISDRAHEEALAQYIERVQKNNKAIDQLAKDRGIK